MNKKNLRKVTRIVLLCTFILLVVSAIIHNSMTHKQFALLHIAPGIIFTVFSLVHMNLNNFPFRKARTKK